ncbi:MAG: RNA polymerase sigma-70 factor [Candidatus Pseudobacter hemicellulosilyticus]|uniref:RNA polymerase sigma-70 factor n=1 Tax=Candidatus Pseudobacter hemicellulosilyticus TaxID=3121375 RepID=A0AAJ5WXA1_9BACT|nr:MAG: RNA polymerase sigma-70 factor [Pseudobacter sp.]
MNSAHYQNDQDLVAGFNKGEESAFEVLYHGFHKRLVYFASSMVSNQREAEDIVMDVFMKLFNRAGHFPDMNHIRAFLYIATRNACLNYLKYEQTHTRVVAEAAYLSDQLESSTALDFERMSAEVLQQVYAEIENLPPQSRRVFFLKAIKHLKSREVAAQMGISDKTVRNQMAIAARQLRKAIWKRTVDLTVPLAWCCLIC